MKSNMINIVSLALLITPFVRKKSLPFAFMFDSQTIIPTESSKYLGITIDNQLSFIYLFYLIAYLSSYHEKAINALYELA